MFSSRKNLVKGIAEERIRILFSLAEKTVGEDRDLARKYVSTMRNISSHYKVSLPKKVKNGICTHCNEVLVPGLNSTVRIVSSNRYVAYKCDSCGKEVHAHY